ncbi:MAG: hypothetical protein OEZ43_21205 [Gammaproteobacteria bacterium]|nr:hypothetical protein [Gammaproteobacteria bacterium]
MSMDYVILFISTTILTALSLFPKSRWIRVISVLVLYFWLLLVVVFSIDVVSREIMEIANNRIENIDAGFSAGVRALRESLYYQRVSIAIVSSSICIIALVYIFRKKNI